MAADPLVGKVLAERFEILERIGEGGTGVVYKAKQITVDRDIAIKVLGAHVSSDPQWVKRFHNEARAAAKLHHSNTVQLIDFGQTREGLLFIAMELLQGRSLRDEIDKAGRFPPARALRIISQACGSVGEAHSMGIIHRDIKPDNLYLVDFKGAGDFVKVLDFSVAKMDTADSMQTRAGIVFGTPAYMSPEQGRGAKLGPQSDIYAFGIVLYEMLNGKPPFDSKIPTEVVMMHLRDKPQPIAGVPDALNTLVLRTLDKDPAKRQQTCEELADECEQLLQEIQPHTPAGMKAYGTGRHGPVQGGAGTGPMKPILTPAGGQQAMRGGAGQQAAAPASQQQQQYQQQQQQYQQQQQQQYQQQQQQQYQQQQQQQRPAPASAGNEQRTMIAEAPVVPASLPRSGQGAPPSSGYGAPPPAAWPPPSSANASPAPYRPPPAVGASGSAGSTVMLPDSQGVVAFAREQAEAVRRAAAVRAAPPPPAPAHWSFWAAWVVLGIGVGVAVHFVTLHSQLAGAAG